MAKFSLSILTSRGEIPLTSFNSNEINQDSLTFDEKIDVNTTSSSLSFSMFKYKIGSNKQELNYAATLLTHGAIIRVITKDKEEFRFNIDTISYEFTSDNVKMNFSAVNSFEYELRTLNIGYSITNNTSDIDYIGAQSIDSWARKIIGDANTAWSYAAIDAMNANLIKRDNLHESYNLSVSFSCSNSNTFAAIKQLADDNELILNVVYSTKTFYFTPAKNGYFKGVYFDPSNNIQSFGLQVEAKNLSTVLNVTGPKDFNNQEITLVPTLPAKVKDYIMSNNWETSGYYADMYRDLYVDSTIDSVAQTFLDMAPKVPWLENKLINLDYFIDTLVLDNENYQKINNILCNDLRKANGKLMLSTIEYLQNYETSYKDITDLQISIDAVNASLYSEFVNFIDRLYTTTVAESAKEVDFRNYDLYHNEVDNWTSTSHTIADNAGFITNKINTQIRMREILNENTYLFKQLFNTIYKDNKTYGQWYFENCESTDSEIIIECAQIAAQFSDYWRLMHTAASCNGIYLPETWDNCLALKNGKITGLQSYYYAIKYIEGQQTLIQINPDIPNINISNPPVGLKNCRVMWKVIKDTDGVLIDNDYHLWTSGLTSYDGYWIQHPAEYASLPNIYKLYFKIIKEELNITYTPVESWSWKYADIFNSDIVPYTEHLPLYSTEIDNPFAKLLFDANVKPFDKTSYNNNLNRHNQIWRQLYAEYPEIFRETNYTNSDAANPQQLYTSAVAQLAYLSKPESSYTLTAIDVGALTGTSPFNLRLGDQIRILYEDKHAIYDEVYNAIKDPLYITSIAYSLRSDSDISFGIVASKATDKMIQRLARVLNFAKLR